MGLPTDRQPATVLHHVDVFFLHRETSGQEVLMNLMKQDVREQLSPCSQQEVPVSTNKGADVLFPPEVTLPARPFQRQIVHGQHHHLTGNKTSDWSCADTNISVVVVGFVPAAR